MQNRVLSPINENKSVRTALVFDVFSDVCNSSNLLALFSRSLAVFFRLAMLSLSLSVSLDIIAYILLITVPLTVSHRITPLHALATPTAPLPITVLGGCVCVCVRACAPLPA